MIRNIYKLEEAEGRFDLIKNDIHPKPYQNIREAIIVFYLDLCLVRPSLDEALKDEIYWEIN